ncbi:MAG TPA: glycosyltransferase [Bacteroidales bacterium]|nr:glycosyltransferase [Bacteroidales bacterium]
MYFSIIIPLFNRPSELDELLLSLCNQTNKKFEVIIAEDGSTIKSDKVVEKYKDKLSIIYFEKPNSGPGLTRNKGAEKANYDWLIFFDSDCIIPKNYIESVTSFLNTNSVDAYGGPDAALSSFTPVQKAINYSMTSFFTTGGIRGGSKTLDKFYPRSFNLGVSRKAFDTLNGYGKMRFGEDIDFSLRLLQAGFKTSLIPDAFVYHKRRANLRQFFKQVFNSGIARIDLHLLHPGSLKLVHSLPACFVMGVAVILILSLFYPILLLLLISYSIIVFIDSLIKNRSIKVALCSIASSWVQLVGYGSGFISAFWNRLILKKGEYNAFEKKFYD